jgi:phosphatidylglycerophosphatase A
MQKLFKWLVITFATGLGTGFCPFAPGTVGSLVGMIVYFLARNNSPGYFLSLIFCCLVGSYTAHQAEKTFGQKDSRKITIDEITGFLLAFFLIPFRLNLLIGGFLIYRAFDVIKPLGIRKTQSLPGGWGIMIDDLLAGLLTNLILRIWLKLTI